MEFLEGKYLVVHRSSPFESLNLGDYMLDWYDSLEDAEDYLTEIEVADKELGVQPIRYQEILIIKVERAQVQIRKEATESQTDNRMSEAKLKLQDIAKIDWRDLNPDEHKYIAALEDYVEGRRDEPPIRAYRIG